LLQKHNFSLYCSSEPPAAVYIGNVYCVSEQSLSRSQQPLNSLMTVCSCPLLFHCVLLCCLFLASCAGSTELTSRLTVHTVSHLFLAHGETQQLLLRTLLHFYAGRVILETSCRFPAISACWEVHKQSRSQWMGRGMKSRSIEYPYTPSINLGHMTVFFCK
jgi:hypothetical protein